MKYETLLLILYTLFSFFFSLFIIANLEDYTTTKVFWIDVILTLRKHG